MQNVREFTNRRKQTMTDLLTTKQVQTLLRVDRTTIYRMVESGQLPAMRVGKQWRFAQADVERWLQSGRYGALPAAAAELGPAGGSALASAAPHAALADILPVACAQAVQDTFADMLSVTMVITDMQGLPVTQISNPCGFFSALMDGNPDGLQHCIHTWQQLAGHVALEPKFSLSEMGLMCARGLIRVGAELKGMVVVGGIAPDNWPPSAEHAAELADLFGVRPETVAVNFDLVFRMDRAAQERALRYVQRMADVFSQMVQDRLATVQPQTITSVNKTSGGSLE
jgi:excisionase family DNA binding protein